MFRGFLILLATTTALTAEPRTGLPKAHPLYRQVAELDREFFGAYNNCDLAKLGGYVAEDLEFYHDKSGLSVGRAKLVEAVNQNICGRVQRALVSMEVYLMDNFGAVQIGVHRFLHPNAPKERVGEAKFVQIWRKDASGWKLIRVISFDHYALGE